MELSQPIDKLSSNFFCKSILLSFHKCAREHKSAFFLQQETSNFGSMLSHALNISHIQKIANLQGSGQCFHPLLSAFFCNDWNVGGFGFGFWHLKLLNRAGLSGGSLGILTLLMNRWGTSTWSKTSLNLFCYGCCIWYGSMIWLARPWSFKIALLCLTGCGTRNLTDGWFVGLGKFFDVTISLCRLTTTIGLTFWNLNRFELIAL